VKTKPPSIAEIALEYSDGCQKLFLEKLEILMAEILKERRETPAEARKAGIKVHFAKTMQPGETIAIVALGERELGRVEGRMVSTPGLRYDIKVYKKTEGG
jgi:hypothetical protein